jgi:hypothetical protein
MEKIKMDIKWKQANDLPDGVLKRFSRLFEIHPPEDLIANVKTELKVVQVTEQVHFPVSINHTEEANSYVCSPYTAYILYSREELKTKVNNKLVRWILLSLIKGIEFWFKLGNIDRNVQINNFLLSTNPYPHWNGENLTELTEFIKKNYPKHAIIFRSLNTHQHQSLIHLFESCDYHKIASRQVYIYDEPENFWLKHKNNKHDRRILKKQKLTYIDHAGMKGFLEEALDLYNQLYLIKYSQFNPQFTLSYFQDCHQNEWMHFQGYADEQGKLKAFAGLFILNQTITSPLVGYDTQASQKEGLYIHAINLIYQYKFKYHLLLNLSSGASNFKRLRGGKPSIEYSTIYTKHLSFKQRVIWSFLKLLSNHIGAPLLKKYEL